MYIFILYSYTKWFDIQPLWLNAKIVTIKINDRFTSQVPCKQGVQYNSLLRRMVNIQTTCARLPPAHWRNHGPVQHQSC